LVKTFLLEKSEISGPTSNAPLYDPGLATAADEPSSILEACEEDVAALEELGWHVNLSENEISLHRYFKNGKLRKGADVGITKYEENPKHPYYVFGPSLASARTFGLISSAIQLFAEEAVNHAPRNST